MNDKRARIETYILNLAKDVDKFGGTNHARYTALFSKMDNNKFDAFMHALRDGKTQISMILPNNTSHVTTNDVIDLAKKRKVKMFSKIWFHDMHTGRKYLTKYEMMVLKLPIRRQSQYLFHKISLPDGDSHINPVTGQVIPPDKGAALSAIETQVLASKGLKTSIIELLKIRAGDVKAYQAMKYTIEEQGDVSMSDIPLTGRPRSAITASKYFHALGVDINI